MSLFTRIARATALISALLGDLAGLTVSRSPRGGVELAVVGAPQSPQNF